MNLQIVVNQILILFLIILVGYIIKKKDIINEEINKGLSNILLEITLPALIINSLISIKITSEIIYNLKVITIVSLLSYLMLIILVTLITKYMSLSINKRTVFIFLIVFANVGYMGLPVVNAVYPDYGIPLAIINNAAFNIFVWTYGVYIFTSARDKGKIKLRKLLNNGIIAVIIGFIILFTGINLGPVHGALESVGHMTFPLSMLIIGSSLTNVKFKKILKDKSLYLLIFLKLLILPVLGLFILRQFNIPEIVSNISVMMLAMPSGAIGVIFAEKYDSDYTFASEGVFFTTLFSIVTIPLIIYLINLF
ncbi:MAG: AEC family transporter [Halothermotrichaceae bacterium]